MTIVAAAFMVPVFIIFNYSFKTKKELYLGNPFALPGSLTLDNYAAAYKKLDLATTFFNTLLYTVVSVIILALICGMTAWAIARCKKKFFKFSYIYFIVGYLIPYQALFSPIYIVGNKPGFTNTRHGIIFYVYRHGPVLRHFPHEQLYVHRAGGVGGGGQAGRLLRIADLLLRRAAVAETGHGHPGHYAVLPDLERLSVGQPVCEQKEPENPDGFHSVLFSAQASDYNTAMAAVVISVLPWQFCSSVCKNTSSRA